MAASAVGMNADALAPMSTYAPRLSTLKMEPVTLSPTLNLKSYVSSRRPSSMYSGFSTAVDPPFFHARSSCLPVFLPVATSARAAVASAGRDATAARIEATGRRPANAEPFAAITVGALIEHAILFFVPRGRLLCSHVAPSNNAILSPRGWA